MLTDASGGRHYLDSVVVTGAIAPALIREPFIEPTRGLPGTFFTITDDQGRIQQGDIAVFYLNGSPSELGLPADNVEISDGGKKLTGNVPAVRDRDAEHAVAVRPDDSPDSRFGDLLFFVQA